MQSFWPATGRRLRESSVPYLSVLVVTVLVAQWANYLAPLVHEGGVQIRGQSLGIAVPLIGLPVLLALWIVYRGGEVRSPWLTVVTGGLVAAWLVQYVIARVHGDQVAHLVWLFVPVLLMVWWKPPNAEQAWSMALIVAWGLVAILVGTRLGELLGLLPVYPIPADILEWERGRYWLPVSGLVGLEDRWPGPFGYNSKTGFMGAVLVVIGAVRWRWHSAVFVAVGLLAILTTAARGSTLGMLVGLAVILVFRTRGPLARIPLSFRVGAAAAGVLATALVLLVTGTGSTGRLGDSGIWAKFIELWSSSPWLGVGQVGILADPATGPIMEAHNLYLQQLTRFGVIGFASVYLVIATALALMVVAAFHGTAWPLALTLTYLTASFTDVFQDGLLQFSPYSLILLVSVLGGAASAQRPPPAAAVERSSSLATGVESPG